MIDNNLNPSQGKTCSCPRGKICSGCKKKKVLKPLIYVEEPRRLPVPIAISQIQDKTERAKNFLKRKISADDNYDTNENKWNPIRKLSKNRQSVNERQLEIKKEKRRQEEEKKRFEREYGKRRKKEKRWEEDQKKLEEKFRRREKEHNKEDKHKKLESRKVQSLPSPKTEKDRYNVRERAASASPRTGTKYVTVKRDHNCPTRLSNCFYRLCCQFYCYLTCVIFLGVLVICII